MKSIFVVCALSAVAALAQPSSEVRFSNCTEYVGTGTVPVANAAGLVPASFSILGAQGGTATLVARVSNCAAVEIDNAKPEALTLAQIGVSVVSPDGTGDINNYTVAYVTNSRRLAQRLERAGLPATVDEDLVYEVSAGKLFADVSPAAGPAFFFNGTVTEPAPNSAFPFLANWWYESQKGRLKMSTAIPSIAFGQSAMTVYGRKESPLGKLMGGNSFSGFNGFNVRGVFATARMAVTLD